MILLRLYIGSIQIYQGYNEIDIIFRKVSSENNVQYLKFRWNLL